MSPNHRSEKSRCCSKVSVPKLEASRHVPVPLNLEGRRAELKYAVAERAVAVEPPACIGVPSCDEERSALRIYRRRGPNTVAAAVPRKRHGECMCDPARFQTQHDKLAGNKRAVTQRGHTNISRLTEDSRRAPHEAPNSGSHPCRPQYAARDRVQCGDFSVARPSDHFRTGADLDYSSGASNSDCTWTAVIANRGHCSAQIGPPNNRPA